MSFDRSPPGTEVQPTPPKGVSLHLGGLAEGTPVLTARGLVPVERLQAGTRLVTRERGMQPLAFVTQRLLAMGEVIRLKPQALGGGAGDADLILAPSQRVLLHDWRAKAMFGHGKALVAAQKLVDGEWIARKPARNLRLYSLHFEAELIVYAGEVELCSAAPVTAFLSS